MAPARPAPKQKRASEPEPEDPVLTAPLSGLDDDSLGILGAAFNGLHVQTPEGKAKEKETG